MVAQPDRVGEALEADRVLAQALDRQRPADRAGCEQQLVVAKHLLVALVPGLLRYDVAEQRLLDHAPQPVEHRLRRVTGCRRELQGAQLPVAQKQHVGERAPDVDCQYVHLSVTSHPTADCLPVLLTDREGKRIMAIHAGWRGLVAGVIQATIEHLTAIRRAGADLILADGDPGSQRGSGKCQPEGDMGE